MNLPVEAQVRGVAKTNDHSPFTIANEIISARIGQIMGLPVPTGVVGEAETKKLYYFSLDVSKDNKTLPPIIAADFVHDEPWWSAGCTVLDILIANGDRNTT